MFFSLAQVLCFISSVLFSVPPQILGLHFLLSANAGTHVSDKGGRTKGFFSRRSYPRHFKCSHTVFLVFCQSIVGPERSRGRRHSSRSAKFIHDHPLPRWWRMNKLDQPPLVRASRTIAGRPENLADGDIETIFWKAGTNPRQTSCFKTSPEAGTPFVRMELAAPFNVDKVRTTCGPSLLGRSLLERPRNSWTTLEKLMLGGFRNSCSCRFLDAVSLS